VLPYSYHRRPNAHVFLPQLLPPDLYRNVKFPEIPMRGKGRSGRDLFVGEPGWPEAVASPGLRELYALFSSPAFVQWVVSLFADDLIRLQCLAHPRDIRLAPYLETRDELDERPDVLDPDADPAEVFTRFDFTVGAADYTPYVHLDSIRRIVGGVLFLSDAAEERIEGGEFTLYRDWLFRDDRMPHWPHAARKIPVRGNTGVLFLNSNRGFHGPGAIRSIQGARRWIYYSISSKNQAWQPHDQGFARRTATRATGKVLRLLGLGPHFQTNPQSKLDANFRETRERRSPPS
jgi:hypothetical protein